MKAFRSALLFVVVVQGCANAPVNNKSAQAAYEGIESRLLAAGVLRVDYQIEARGGVLANLTGDLVMQKPTLAAIKASGSFLGNAVAPVMVADGIRLRGGNAPDYIEQDSPADLRAGLLIGLMRMGILHNLAQLASGAAPEGTDGGVREWVVAQHFDWLSSTRGSADRPLRGISFAIAVGGEPAGDVVLWYDPKTGLPVEREQTVYFDNGEMQVTERYVFETDGMVGPCRFDLDSIR